jgi:hypothetical protein
MTQLAWCFIRFQKDSALAKWFDLRTADGRGSTRKTMIVALARKLLIALWRLVTRGEVPDGVALRPASALVSLAPNPRARGALGDQTDPLEPAGRRFGNFV